MTGVIRHALPSRMLERSWNVIVVGAGGTGSALLPSLARLHHAMVELGHPGGIDCTVYDDDTVSPTNVGRQGFYPNDVGEYKASLIVNRLNALMGTNWRAQTTRFTRSVSCYNVDLVIGCVDTRVARRAIVDATKTCDLYYLDCGNDTDRGQVVIGQAEPRGYQKVKKANPERLPHVGQLFPELIDPSLDAKDQTPSCSMAEALRKQSLVINQAISVQAFNLLWTMFRTGAVPFSGVFVNLATGRTNPIPLDAAAWARFGYDPLKPSVKKVSKGRKLKLAA
ncbi:UBA/THIF-type NAD/FAD binding fold [Candidatus Burkholderia verschuerenii]|uniref:UBA/THIF-type NAD/FAD binding fold n=1 Tax=Candidatus Burkholderia verschuerenii TaxID=242163 RepID=A0A0L0M538_9BURK|nr:PRTRC system ThiF family protein [Candidatus Burkholderia verschuerenii]KND57498.1 UBA/THIF-type NAD/FAD binding fold [Candidatus Burkholderia verschuerenii]